MVPNRENPVRQFVEVSEGIENGLSNPLVLACLNMLEQVLASDLKRGCGGYLIVKISIFRATRSQA